MNYTKAIPLGSSQDSDSQSNSMSQSRTNTRCTPSSATTVSTNTLHTLESIAATIDLLAGPPDLNAPTNVTLRSPVSPLPQMENDALAMTTPHPSLPLLSPYATDNKTSDSDFDVCHTNCPSFQLLTRTISI